MLVDDYLMDDDPYETERVRRVRKSAIIFFGLFIILMFISRFVIVKYDPATFAEAKANFLNGSIADWDLILMYCFGPAIYFGWTTINKILNKLFGYRLVGGSIIVIAVYFLFKLFASVFLGLVILPILVIFNLIKLLFAGALSRNRIVQFFS